MSISHRSSKTNIGDPDVNTLEAMVRRWRVTSREIRKTLAGIRDPRLRADIQRLVDAHAIGQAPEVPPPPEERAQALAMVCEALLRQFDDEQAGAAEIRLVVHKRDTEPASDGRPDSGSLSDVADGELLWELRRLLASSGGTIADVAHALERRGDDVDHQGRALLQDEVSDIEMDIAMLKVLLSDAVDWDQEGKRLLAGEIPPFDDHVVEDDEDDEDD
jgi:hypothetical protein